MPQLISVLVVSFILPLLVPIPISRLIPLFVVVKLRKKTLSRVSFPVDPTENISDTISIPFQLSVVPSSIPIPTPIVPPIILPASSLPSTPTIDPLPSSSPSSGPAIGDVGYTFLKFFPNHGKFQEGVFYQGEVTAFKSVSTDGKDRRCRYTDDDEEDLHLNEIKQCNRASPHTYNPSRRSTRKKRASSKASVNITIEKMAEIQATPLRLKVKKSK